MTMKHRIRLADPKGAGSPPAGSVRRQDERSWSSRRDSEVILRLQRGGNLDVLYRGLRVSSVRLADRRNGAVADGPAPASLRAVQQRLSMQTITA